MSGLVFHTEIVAVPSLMPAPAPAADMERRESSLIKLQDALDEWAMNNLSLAALIETGIAERYFRRKGLV